jgi:hypothetical protein
MQASGQRRDFQGLILELGLCYWWNFGLAEGRSLKHIWPQCYEWTFPYFLVGAAVAGLASVSSRASNLGVTLLILPVMYFVYLYYRMHIIRVVLDSISNVSQQNEADLVGASRGR